MPGSSFEPGITLFQAQAAQVLMAKVLVVDDDLTLLSALERWLIAEEYEVEAVSSGARGWALVSAGDFDLVILDWDMPDMDGIEILKRYRDGGGVAPVLMLTGRGHVDFRAEGLDSGADDYLTKPFDFKELLARLRVALRKPMAAPPLALGSGNQDVLAKMELAGTALASRYEFISVLGEGAVGIVFKAKHPQLEKLVAVKMIQRNELRPEVQARFEQEARAISKLDHPNIADVFDFGLTERKQPYMVMEFVEGKTLQKLLHEQDHLTFDQSIGIFLQVCEGLSHAHELGIIHRDVKPANIILKEVAGTAPVVKILDFGCAKIRDLSTKQSPILTKVGEIVGSPPYMSPEQIQGQPMDQRSDIYSLGCTLYETLTGYVPHVGDDPIEILVKHLEQEVLPMRKLCPDFDIAIEMEGPVAIMLEKNPDKRYRTMREVSDELMRIKHRKSTSSGSDWFGRVKQIAGNIRRVLQGGNNPSER